MSRVSDKDFIGSAKNAAALTEEEKEAIRNLEKTAVESSINTKQQTQQNASKNLYNQIYGTQATALDTIRRSNAEAIATGASKGVQAANELSSILDMQNTSAEEATRLADEDYALADEYETSLLEASRLAEQNISAKESANLTDITAGLATKYQADTEYALTPSPGLINDYLAEGNEAAAKSVYFQLNPDKTDDDWDLYRSKIRATQAENNPAAPAEEKAKTQAEAKEVQEEADNADHTFSHLKNPSGLNRGGDIFTMVSKSGKEYKLTTEMEVYNTSTPMLSAETRAKVAAADTGQLFLLNNRLMVKDSGGNLRTVTGPGYNAAYDSMKHTTKYNLGDETATIESYKKKVLDDFKRNFFGSKS